MKKNGKINVVEVVKSARSVEELHRMLETMNIKGIRLLCGYYGCKPEKLEEKILNEVTNVNNL